MKTKLIIVFKSLLVSLIAWLIFYGVCELIKHIYMNTGGIMLASELSQLKFTPYIMAVVCFIAAYYIETKN